jgi:hypothetical protein
VALLAGTVAALGVFMRGEAVELVTSIRGEDFWVVTDGVYAFNAQRLVAEGIGWDLFTLFVAVPALLISAAFTIMGSTRARLVSGGLLAYLFYQYFMYSVTWAYGPLFPAFIVLYALSLVGSIWAIWSVGVEVLDVMPEKFPHRTIATLTFATAVMLLVVWSGRIGAGLAGDFEEAMLLGQTTLVVPAMDLGLVVPALLFTGAAVLRRMPIGKLVAGPLLVVMVSMGAAVSAMILWVWWTTTELEIVPLVVFGALTIASLAIAIRVFQRVGPQEPTSIPIRHTEQQAPA